MADVPNTHMFEFELPTPTPVPNPVPVDPVEATMSDADEDNEGDYAFVDRLEYQGLQAKVNTMERNMSSINSNLTMLTELVNKFVHAQGASGSAMPIKEPEVVPAHDEITDLDATLSGPTEAVSLLKSLKPPVFRGEEKERNKDSVNTFLTKWRDIHRMRRTTGDLAPMETSFTLEGKAYKWWMAFKSHNRPQTWSQFDAAFRKEFLPSNEKKRNWDAWDMCRQKHRTLSQYISLYRDVILKLDNLDDFQQVRGFLRGLNPDLQKEVESKAPKTLEEAIHQAHIYADDTAGPDNRSTTHVSNKFKSFSTTKEDKKRRHEPDSLGTTKKPKGTRGSLTQEEFLKAKKENLCFKCLGKHPKKDCPVLKGSTKEKGKVVHTVQLLPLESPKYASVEVSHTHEEHECCLTTSMWQPQFGPHELVRMHGSIHGHKVRVLVDDGATHNFLNYRLVKRLKLKQTPSTHSYKVQMIKDADSEVWDTEVLNVPLEIQSHTMNLNFQVMHMDRADVVLGREWLHSLGHSLKRSYEHNSFMFDSNGTHVLLLGEKNVPPSPLICTAELSKLSLNNEIAELFCLRT